MFDGLPLLTLLLCLPLGVSAGVWLLPESWSRPITLACLSLMLLLCGGVVTGFDASRSGFQWVHEWPWMPSLNIHYRVGVDGISLFFLPATVLLFMALLLTTWRSVGRGRGLHDSLLLILLAATLGVFLALDTVFFFFCWEMTLIPLYFLMSLWGGGAQRRQAVGKYFFMMLASGVPLLLGFLILALDAGGAQGPLFNLPLLLQHTAPRSVQVVVFLLFVLGFGVKVPFVPLHTWLPSLAIHGPATMLALLAGLKLGAYGLLRIAATLTPHAATEFHWLLAGLGTLGILYGAVTAVAHTNLKAVLACWSVSHVGLVVLGVSSHTAQGLQGSVLLLLSFVLASGGMCLLLDNLERRTGSCDISQLGGLADAWPRLAGFFLLFGLVGLGMPGTLGFPAELGIILSALKLHSGAGLAALFGLVVGAGAFLNAYRSAFFGPSRQTVNLQLPDLLPRELAWALVFAILLILTGLQPEWLLQAIRGASEEWAAVR